MINSEPFSFIIAERLITRRKRKRKERKSERVINAARDIKGSITKTDVSTVSCAQGWKREVWGSFIMVINTATTMGAPFQAISNYSASFFGFKFSIIFHIRIQFCNISDLTVSWYLLGQFFGGYE